MINYFSNKKKLFSTTLVVLFLLLNILTPLEAFAELAPVTSSNGNVTSNGYQSVNGSGSNSDVVIKNGQVVSPGYDSVGTQGIDQKIATESDPNKSGGTGDLATNILTAAGTCSVGAILGRLVNNIISAAINELTSALKSIFVSEAELLVQEKAVALADRSVPINYPALLVQQKKQTDNGGKLADKSVGGGKKSSILSGLLDITNISMDSIMFCIVNEILTYITQSTIQWINTGFKGNPVFIQNPGALFEGIADQEAGNFLFNLQRGVNQRANGLSYQQIGGNAQIFGPIQQQVIGNTINAYNASLATQLQPLMTTAQYNNLYSGTWRAGNFDAMMVAMDPRHNAFGATNFIVQPAMYAQIARQQQLSQLQYQTNGGYHSYTLCPDGHLRAYDGSCDPRFLQITTTGNQIQNELQSRNMMKYMRVSFAKDFDSIVTALVNQLIKIAINKIFEGEQKVNGSTQGATR